MNIPRYEAHEENYNLNYDFNYRIMVELFPLSIIYDINSTFIRIMIIFFIYYPDLTQIYLS